MGELLPFPTQDRRCCRCEHWTPLDAHSPFGLCEINGEKCDLNWSCPQFRAAWPASQKEDVETGE